MGEKKIVLTLSRHEATMVAAFLRRVNAAQRGQMYVALIGALGTEKHVVDYYHLMTGDVNVEVE